MPTRVSINTTDFRRIDDFYQNIGDALSENEFGRLHVKSARPPLLRLRDDFRALTPLRSGNLRRSVGLSSLNQSGRIPGVRIGYKLRRGGGVSVSQALGVEFGNQRVPRPAMAAQRILRANKDTILQEYAKNLDIQLEAILLGNG